MGQPARPYQPGDATWLTDQHAWLQVEYPPDLNPVEGLGANLKGASPVSNGYGFAVRSDWIVGDQLVQMLQQVRVTTDALPSVQVIVVQVADASACYRVAPPRRDRTEDGTAIPESGPTTQILEVPGARLYYERRGSGPLLPIGSPMDSSGSAGLAAALADRYTVVNYDPRGIANSSRGDTTEDVTPEEQADDVHRLLLALGGGPAEVFGSSGGAVVGLALVTAHPEQMRTLVAHEPPVVELLPDSAQRRAEIDDIYETYRAEGADKAMQKFMAHAGLGQGPAREPDAPQWEPSAEQIARMRATTDHFLAHLLLPTTRFRPDIQALRAASTRVVVAGGATSKGQLANRTAVALAEQLGTTVVDFPGDHGGFLALPEQFGRVLDQVLTETT